MARTEHSLVQLRNSFNANESPRTLERLRWQYFDMPRKDLYVDFAVTRLDDPPIAAAYCVIPLAARIRGVPSKIVQSIDTLTDARYRGRGLFVQLAESVYSRCEADGNVLVFGFPNGSSAHGFFRRLRWTQMDPVPFVVRPLKVGYLLRRMGPAFGKLAQAVDFPFPIPKEPRLGPHQKLVEIQSLDTECTRVWNKFADGITCAVDRSSEYLRWRLARPGEEYSVYGFFDEGILEGFVIIGVTHHAKGVTGKLMDVIYVPERKDVGRILVAYAIRRLREAGCDVVWAWNFGHSPNHSALRSAGFFAPPQRLLAAELHFGCRPLALEGDMMPTREDWYISLLDSDTD